MNETGSNTFQLLKHVLGTTSSNNTVVAGQDGFADTDETKASKEEER